MTPDPSPLTIFLPDRGDELASRFARLDPQFADLWSAHATRLLGRNILDPRTRFLILTGQYTVTGMTTQLEENLGAALTHGVPSQELLEIILQCYVYTGPWVVSAACETYERVLASRNMTTHRSEQPPPVRSLSEERELWSSSDRLDPRLEPLLDRYGWKGIATGLRLRPGHHINLVDTLDALDPDFLEAWLAAVYEGLYSRMVLDDRTRLLAVVGSTLALGEQHQSRRHMRAALRSGASPRELLEVIVHTTVVFGHPHVMPAAIDDLIQIVDQEGRLDELLDERRMGDIRRIVAARVARRQGVSDDLSTA